MKNTVIFGFTKNEIISLSLMILLLNLGFGSIVNNSFFSNNDRNSVYIILSILVFLYLFTIAVLLEMGFKLNKFEIILIPSSIILIIGIVLYYANLLPPLVDDDPIDITVLPPINSDDEIDRSISTDMNSNQKNINNTINQTENLSQTNTYWQNIINSISILSFVFIIIMIYQWYIKRNNEIPDFGVGKIKDYTKSTYHTNNSIIEYYILSSKLIEKNKGQAPTWYSPTRFSNNVQEKPGPPLSSYFDILTTLYEEARFGKIKMSEQKVNESKDLYEQIKNSTENTYNKAITEKEYDK